MNLLTRRNLLQLIEMPFRPGETVAAAFWGDAFVHQPSSANGREGLKAFHFYSCTICLSMGHPQHHIPHLSQLNALYIPSLEKWTTQTSPSS